MPQAARRCHNEACYGRGVHVQAGGGVSDGVGFRRMPEGRRAHVQVRKVQQCAAACLELSTSRCVCAAPTNRVCCRAECGRGEGAEAKAKQSGGECAKGGKHVFKFGKCTKCGALENEKIAAGK